MWIKKYDSIEPKKFSAAFREAERYISVQKIILIKEAQIFDNVKR